MTIISDNNFSGVLHDKIQENKLNLIKGRLSLLLNRYNLFSYIFVMWSTREGLLETSNITDKSTGAFKQISYQ